ncbi:MAG: SRPBCC family protein [Marmoricola sp.]
MSKHGVITISRDISSPARGVWDVLSDGWLYPSWVVGAARMRDVDASWPAVGSRLHHSVGNWPLLLDDSTEVLESDPGRLLRLKAHGWPAGAAEVVLEIEELGAGSRVHIREDAVAGPGTIVPKPLRQLAIAPRNRETLRRLAFLAEGR